MTLLNCNILYKGSEKDSKWVWNESFHAKQCTEAKKNCMKMACNEKENLLHTCVWGNQVEKK